MHFFRKSTVSRCAPATRRLRLEPLEDRRMLAVFTVDNVNDAGAGSLRQAIEDANAAAGADVIEFQAGLAGTIALSTGELSITDELVIDGPGANEITIDAQQNSRIFHIGATSGDVTLEGLHLTGGDAPGSGGAILSETNALLAIQSSTISGNSAIGGFVAVDFGDFFRFEFGGGGGVSAIGNLAVTGSTISGNSVTVNEAADSVGAGGGIRAFGDATVTDSTISGNSVSGNSVTGFESGRGGGIAALGDATIVDSTISGNSVTGDDSSHGGGIHASGDVTITDNMISANSAVAEGAQGGGVYADGDVTVTNSTISGNSADGTAGAAGGISARGHVRVFTSTISDNWATGSSLAQAGGIGTFADLTITDSTISGNIASAGNIVHGGGILANGNTTVTRSTISNNSAIGGNGLGSRGGGIFANSDVTVTDSTISGNSATGKSVPVGGGVFADHGDVMITRSTISGNSATGSFSGAFGGGIGTLGDATVTITSSTISVNSATGGSFLGLVGGGGGVWVLRNALTIENSIAAGNHSLDGSAPDMQPGNGPLSVRHSLIGDNTDTNLAPAPVGMPDANGNLIGTAAAPIDPMIGPLQDNGGPTFTHALLAGSPAIDAGDNTGAPPTDQRGFVRIVDGGSGQKIIDMGAYEFAATLAGDGNGDGHVGEEDYTVWANNFGTSGDGIPGDYNNDGIVGPQDYTVWANNFGAGTPPGEAAVSLRPVEPALQNVVAGLLTEPLTQGATGSASATSARPITPILRVPPAAHDAAIQALLEEGIGARGRAANYSLDRVWALLNAGFLESDGDDMVIDVGNQVR